MWNMNVNSKTTSKISDVMLANIQALAQSEGGWNDGWDELETTIIQKLNGQPLWETVNVDCAEGGPKSSCESYCKKRLWINGDWGDWTEC